jgi:hypothetical protein
MKSVKPEKKKDKNKKRKSEKKSLLIQAKKRRRKRRSEKKQAQNAETVPVSDDSRRSLILNKRKEAIKKAEDAKEKESREVFEKKLEKASSKKAPVTSRTRGYYRFSRDFPSNTDENGFRENVPYSRKRRTRTIIFAVLGCILAFVIGFIPTKTAMYISDIPLDTSSPANAEDEEEAAVRGMFVSYDELKANDSAAIIEKLKKNNLNCAVFEFKTDDGYCIFNTGSFVGSSADRRISTAFDTALAVKEAGYEIYAYISCFKDSCAPSSDYTYAVRSGSAEGGAWLDNSGSSWLNPYSSTACEYIAGIVKAAADGGFTDIILANVCFPTDSGETEAYFDGESTSGKSRNDILRSFVDSAVKAAGEAKVTVMCDLNAVNSSGDNTQGGTDGCMFGTAADGVCISARSSEASSVETVGTKEITGANKMPYVYVSEIAKYAVNNRDAYTDSNDKIYLIIDGGTSASDGIDAVTLCGGDGYFLREG